ncbi:hypothetical protein BJ322DRAFT_1018437 [Thelephora terrestris]|uniref:Uncharacterized protein n=1 Tax=Thelephora terrestris TaxID=56493 RepID=A0A9P6HM72_9AGAM|nr:hypothetical protein BJ322DRAFT_1018437 [Thelephora terrestris]
MFGSLDEDFSHFALEHWGPFQASLYRYFGHDCRGIQCCDMPQPSTFVPPTPPGSQDSSPSIPSLESCSSSSNGGEDRKEESQESDDSYWTMVSSIKQGPPGWHVAEVGGGESAGQVWVQSRPLYPNNYQCTEPTPQSTH